MKKLIFLLTFSLSLCFFVACIQDTTSVVEELELEEVVAEQAVFGWEVNKLINQSSEVEDLTQNSQLFENEGIEGIYTVNDLKKQACQLFEETKVHKITLNTLQKPLLKNLLP